MMYKKDYTIYESLNMWEKKTIGTHLSEWAERYPERTACTDQERRITYRELYQRALAIAAGLAEKGISQGENVVIQLPNSVTFVEVFFGIILCGAVPIMALPAHRKGDLAGIFDLAQPTAYFIPESYMGFDYYQMAKELCAENSSVKYIFTDSSIPAEGTVSISSLNGSEKVFADVSPYSTALLLLSGGTTGTPKLIPRTHSDYMYNAAAAAEKCGINENSAYLEILPCAHNFSLSCPGMLGVLSRGGKVVMSPSSSPDEVYPLIEKEKITITAMVPALVPIFTEVLEWDLGYDLSSWKLVQVGGALLEPHIAAKIIHSWPCDLMQVFGTAEGLICFTDSSDSEEVICSYQGRPISPADEIRIVDSCGNEVPEGEYGELLARGPYTIDGYYKLEEVNKHCITAEGFYCTGDRAAWSSVNGLKMGGRMKEQINRAGEKVMPAEVEGYLCRHEAIDEAAVIGIPDDELGHRSVAFIKLTEDCSGIDRQDIAVFFKEIGAAHYKIPDTVHVIEQWPVTSVGKIDKKSLYDIAMEKEQDKCRG